MLFFQSEINIKSVQKLKFGLKFGGFIKFGCQLSNLLLIKSLNCHLKSPKSRYFRRKAEKIADFQIWRHESSIAGLQFDKNHGLMR